MVQTVKTTVEVTQRQTRDYAETSSCNSSGAGHRRGAADSVH